MVYFMFACDIIFLNFLVFESFIACEYMLQLYIPRRILLKVLAIIFENFIKNFKFIIYYSKLFNNYSFCVVCDFSKLFGLIDKQLYFLEVISCII